MVSLRDEIKVFEAESIMHLVRLEESKRCKMNFERRENLPFLFWTLYLACIIHYFLGKRPYSGGEGRTSSSSDVTPLPAAPPAAETTAKALEASFARRVFRFDRRIRQFSVIGAVGHELLSASRPNLVSLEPEEETRKILKQIMLMKGILDGQNKYHGRITGAVVIREKLTMIMFDGIDKVYLFSAEPDFPLAKVDKLGKLLDTIPIQ